MQVLLRTYGNGQYVWKTAKHNGNHFFVDGDRVYDTNIVSIMNDNRKNYVVCRSCGGFIKNTPKKIEEHRQQHKMPDACLKCRHVRVRTGDTVKNDVVIKKDGTAVRQTEQSVTLSCTYGQYYGSINVNSEEAKQNCMLKKCESAVMDQFTDFFLEYPGAFDHIAMVDKILDVGYKHRNQGRVTTHYRLKGRNSVYAIVNKFGIIDHFQMSYGDDTWDIYYSKKYDKLFVSYGAKYEPFENPWLPKKTIDYVKRKIAELYN